MQTLFQQDRSLTLFLWMLPLSVFLGTLMDSAQVPNGTQMLFGAANNFVLFFSFFFVFVFTRYTLTLYRTDTPVFLAWASLLFWSWLVLTLDDHFTLLAALSLVVLLIASLFALRLRAVVATHGPRALLATLEGVLLAITLGLVFSAAVHLLGEWPKRQVFLYVDGFSNIRTFGETCLLVWAGLGGFVLTKTARWPLLAWLALFVVSLLLFWSGTRAAWVGAGTALLLVTVLVRSWKHSALLLGVTLAGLGASVLMPIPGPEYGALRFALLEQEVTTAVTQTLGSTAAEEPGTTDTTAPAPRESTRMKLWAWGWNQTLEHPLLGHGLLTMADRSPPDGLRFVHLHNLPLDLAYWLGWPAALLVIGAMAWGWVGLVRATLAQPSIAPLLFVATALCVTSMFAGTMIFLLTLLPTVGALSVGPLLMRTRHA